MKTILLVLLTALCLTGPVLAQNSARPGVIPPAATTPAPAAVQTPAITDVQPLRAQLPPQALGYVRIPSFWGLLTSPKGTVLSNALNDSRHREQISLLQQNLSDNVITPAEAFTHPVLGLLFTYLRSPLEAAVLLDAGMPPPAGNVLLRAQLDLTTLDEANALLNRLITDTPLTITQPFDANGYALLTAEGLPVALHYQPATRTLNALFGMLASAELLQQTLAGLQTQTEHPMYTLEERIDSSGQGLFVWVNAAQVLPQIQAFMPPEEWAQMQLFGLTQARAAAFGLGVSRGKSRLQLLLDLPKAGLLATLPAINNDFSLTVSRRPGVVLAVNLPLAAALQSAEQFAANDPTMQADLNELKTGFQEFSGLLLADVLRAFSGELIMFTDATGEYLAVKLGDRAQWDALLNWLIQSFSLRYETREIAGRVYHHLETPGFMGMETPPPSDAPDEVFATELLTRLQSHYYWTEDNGYLIFAQVPQALFDRDSHRVQISLADWLASEQKQEANNALLLISATLSQTPRNIYYAYLQSLNLLGDLANADIDLFALPSAADLKLPPTGSYGLQVFQGENLSGIEFVFENNPGELLLGMDQGGLVTVAMLGAMAAIAIPAYEDYAERAEEYEDLSEEEESGE